MQSRARLLVVALDLYVFSALGSECLDFRQICLHAYRFVYTFAHVFVAQGVIFLVRLHVCTSQCTYGRGC